MKARFLQGHLKGDLPVEPLQGPFGALFPIQSGEKQTPPSLQVLPEQPSHLFRLSRKDKGAGSAKTRQKAQAASPSPPLFPLPHKRTIRFLAAPPKKAQASSATARPAFSMSTVSGKPMSLIRRASTSFMASFPMSFTLIPPIPLVRWQDPSYD